MFYQQNLNLAELLNPLQKVKDGFKVSISSLANIRVPDTLNPKHLAISLIFPKEYETIPASFGE